MKNTKKDKGKEKVKEDELIAVQDDVEPTPTEKNEMEFRDEIKRAIELSKRSIEDESIKNYIYDQVQPANHARQLEILKLFINESQISTAGAELFYQDIRNGKFNSVQLINKITQALFYRYVTLEQVKYQIIDKGASNEQSIEMIESFKICKKLLISISYRFIKDKIIEDLQKLDDFSYLDDLDLLNSDRIAQYFSQTDNEENCNIKNVIDKYDGKNSKMNNDLSAIISLIDQIKTNIKNTEYGSRLIIKIIEIFSSNETYLNIDEIAQLIADTNTYFPKSIESEQADIKKFVDASIIKFGIFNQSHKLLIQDIYDGKFKSLMLVDILINTIIFANINKAELNENLKNKTLDLNFLEILQKNVLRLIGQDQFNENIEVISNLTKYFDQSARVEIKTNDNITEFDRFLSQNDHESILELTNHYSGRKLLTKSEECKNLTDLRKFLLDNNMFFTDDVIKHILKHNKYSNDLDDKTLYDLDEKVMLELAIKTSEQEQKIVHSSPPEQTSEIIVSLTGQELQEQLD